MVPNGAPIMRSLLILTVLVRYIMKVVLLADAATYFANILFTAIVACPLAGTEKSKGSKHSKGQKRPASSLVPPTNTKYICAITAHRTVLR